MRKLFLTLFALITVSAFGQHERLIVFGGSPIFNFDPLSGSYRSGSLAQLQSYIDAWKAEDDIDNVFICPTKDFFKTLPYAYQLYNKVKDSTLIKSVFEELYVKDVDTSRFELNKYNTDSIRNNRILVIDRYDFFGDISFTHKIVNIKDFPPSSEFLSRFSRQEQQVKQFFSSPIANLPIDYSTRDMFFGPSPLGNLLHNFQLKYADVSIVAPPKKDMTFSKGELYSKDLYEMFPYDNELTVIQAKGAMLKEFLEQVYGGRFYTYKRPTDDLLRIKTPYFFHDAAAGIKFNVNVSNNKGKRIENHNIDLDKTYSIALNSFRAKWFIEKGCSFSNIGQYRILLVDWILNNNINELKSVENWKIVPNANISQTISRELMSAF